MRAKIGFLRHRGTYAPRCAANTRDGQCSRVLTNKKVSFRIRNGYGLRDVTVRVCEKHFKRPTERMYVEGQLRWCLPFIPGGGA